MEGDVSLPAGWPTLAGFRDEMARAESALDLHRGWFTDGDALGPCPCFHLELDALEIDGNCWRPHGHELDPDTDGRCCLHLQRGSLDDAQRLRALLNAMDWYGDWTLIDERGPEVVIVPSPDSVPEREV